MSTDHRIAEREALMAQQEQPAQQREQIAQLSACIRELEGRLATVSHNCSKPPSSDGLRRKTKTLRTPNGKKLDGRLGHRGETLRLQATPDVMVVVAHRPSHCPRCQHPLAHAPAVLHGRRQVQDLPPRRLVVTEHAVACAGILGSLTSLRTQGRALVAALETVFAGQPFAPEFALTCYWGRMMP